MGANCCVPAKTKRLPNSALLEVSTYRNVRQSPSWNFRCDKRTHIEDIINNPSRNYNNNDSGNPAPEIKSDVTTESEGLSDRASPSNDIQTQKRSQSHKTRSSWMHKAYLEGQPIESNSSPGNTKSQGFVSASDAKLTVALPSNPFYSDVLSGSSPQAAEPKGSLSASDANLTVALPSNPFYSDIISDPTPLAAKSQGSSSASDAKLTTALPSNPFYSGILSDSSPQTAEAQGPINASDAKLTVALPSNPFYSDVISDSSSQAAKSQGSVSASDAKLTVSLPSNPFYSDVLSNLSPSRSQSLPSEPTYSKKAHPSPGFKLSWHSSDSRIPSMKSLNENSSPEGWQSYSNDFSAGGSRDGSSDGWSMRTFTELVASSQMERWSFDSEKFLYSNNTSANMDCQQSMPVSPGQQACKICSKLLKDRSPWSSQKLVSTNELSVVAILVCEHVYHAECLETMTHGGDSYDPPCPICINGEKSVAKLFEKVERGRSKKSRIAVADVDQDTFSNHQEMTGKVPGTGSSSSLRRPFSGPFLRRYFSVGRPSQSPSGSESSKGKSFWARYQRG